MAAAWECPVDEPLGVGGVGVRGRPGDRHCRFRPGRRRGERTGIAVWLMAVDDGTTSRRLKLAAGRLIDASDIMEARWRKAVERAAGNSEPG
jgi:hypothetical protein